MSFNQALLTFTFHIVMVDVKTKKLTLVQLLLAKPQISFRFQQVFFFPH